MQGTSSLRALAAVLTAVALVLAACGGEAALTGSSGVCPSPATGPSTVIIDWVPFVKLGDVTYVAMADEPGRPPALDQSVLGPEFGRVRCKIAGAVTDAAYRSKHGDAAFLEPGTVLYSVNGYRPTFLLSTLEDGAVQLYQADTVQGAAVGGDLLDIGGKVAAISIRHGDDGTTELGRVSDPSIIDSFVSAILQAPVDQSPLAPTGAQYFIAFYLRGGIVIQRPYWAGTGELGRGIVLPQAARDVVDAAVGR